MSETYIPPDHGWTCFHCGETFAPHGIHRQRAREHFGETPNGITKCKVMAATIARLEAENARLVLVLKSFKEAAAHEIIFNGAGCTAKYLKAEAAAQAALAAAQPATGGDSPK